MRYKKKSQIHVVFCGSPLCWRVEPVFKSRMDRETQMLSCILLDLMAVSV